MRAQLILDCGGRVLSALLVTADGQQVPCSQDIRFVAARYVSADLLYEPRVAEAEDFIWEDALETVAKATARDFFQRARRIGLRRPWDAQASERALLLASPLAVLSSAVALTDRAARASLPRVAMALLDAMLDPAFSFLAERQIAFAEIDPIVILPAQVGRHARLVLQKLFRRRGFRPPAIVSRDLAAAVARIDEPPGECLVLDASDEQLQLQRVSIEGGENERRFRTLASTTWPALGWNHWSARIAEALHVTATAAFDRALISLLTGSPDSLKPRLTHGALQSALDDAWVAAQRNEIAGRLREIDVSGLRVLFAGELFALDAVRAVFGGNGVTGTPVLDQAAGGIAGALRWLRAAEERQLVLVPGGGLRVNNFHGEAIELVSPEQLPAAGEACFVETDLRFAGEAAKSFVMHLQWGADQTPEGNATLCAMPLELRRDSNDLRLSVHLRRSRSGRRLHGTVEARMARGVVAAQAQFAEELEVRR